MVTSLLLAGVLLANEEPSRSRKEYRLPLDVEKIQKRLAAEGGSALLDLGPFGQLNGGAPSVDQVRTAGSQRFESYVLVEGKAPLDSAQLTARLEAWLRGFDLRDGPAPHGAPTRAEMLEYRPHPAPAANLLPLLEWLRNKAGDKKGESSTP